MRYDIRAMSLSEILDTGFRVVRDHFAVLFPLSLLSYLPIGVGVALATGYIDPATGEFPELEVEGLIAVLLAVLGMLLILSLIFPLVWTATTAGARAAYLGTPVELGEALRLGARKYLHFVWVLTVYTLVMLGVFLLISMAMVAFAALATQLPFAGESDGARTIAVILAILLAIPLVFLLAIGLYAFSFFLTIVTVVEDLGAMDTIRRCWWLLNTARARTLGLSLVVYIITVIPSSASQMFMSFMPVVGGLIWGAVQGIAFSYSVTTFLVFYYDILCREEAFDLEHLAQRVEAEAAPLVHSAPLAER